MLSLRISLQSLSRSSIRTPLRQIALLSSNSTSSTSTTQGSIFNPSSSIYPSTSSAFAASLLNSRLPNSRYNVYRNPAMMMVGGNQQVRSMSRLSSMLDDFKKSLGKDTKARRQLDDLEKQAQDVVQGAAKVMDNEKVKQATEGIKGASIGIGKKIAETFKSAASSSFAQKTMEELGQMSKEGKKFTEKIEETAAQTPYLNKFTSTIKDATDELAQSSQRSARLYGGFRKAEERRREKQKREKLFHDAQKAKDAENAQTEANPEAGSGIVLHKDSSWKQSWNSFRENNPVLQKIFSLKKDFDESDNILVHYMHRIQDSITDMFSETEHAQVIKEIKMLDSTFNLEDFLKEMYDYTIPEVLESFLHGNRQELKQWCSEAAYSVLAATIDEREKAGYHVDSKILDLKDVDLAMAKMIDERPVLVFTFNTQQITVMRDNQGKIVEGKEDDVENVHYVMAVLKEKEFNPFTNGWKVLEIGIQASVKNW